MPANISSQMLTEENRFADNNKRCHLDFSQWYSLLAYCLESFMYVALNVVPLAIKKACS